MAFLIIVWIIYQSIVLEAFSLGAFAPYVFAPYNQLARVRDLATLFKTDVLSMIPHSHVEVPYP